MKLKCHLNDLLSFFKGKKNGSLKNYAFDILLFSLFKKNQLIATLIKIQAIIK